MKRVFQITLTFLTLAAAAFILSRLPLPSTKARNTAGQGFTYTKDNTSITYHLSKPNTAPQKEVVVLLASAGREASDFNELILELNNAGYKTLAVEAPGINGTSLLNNVDLLGMTAPVRQAILQVTPDKPIFLIGHAYGNRLARAYAYKYPDNINSVVLLAAGGQVEIESKAKKALRDIFHPLRSTQSRLKDIQYAFFADGNEVPKYWRRGWHTKTAILHDQTRGLNVTKEWQGASGVPMLVVQPAQDRIAPKKDAADFLAARYPGQVEVVVIENAGHALLPEQPEAVADAVIEFLDRQSAKE